MTKRILIGDDNEDVKASLVNELYSRGLEADLTSTPEDVIRMTREQQYTAIITDLEYTKGGREGYHVLDEIKNSSTVRILYTGLREIEITIEGIFHGADYVILKKDQSELLKIIDSIQEN